MMRKTTLTILSFLISLTVLSGQQSFICVFDAHYKEHISNAQLYLYAFEENRFVLQGDYKSDQLGMIAFDAEDSVRYKLLIQKNGFEDTAEEFLFTKEKPCPKRLGVGLRPLGCPEFEISIVGKALDVEPDSLRIINLKTGRIDLTSIDDLKKGTLCLPCETSFRISIFQQGFIGKGEVVTTGKEHCFVGHKPIPLTLNVLQSFKQHYRRNEEVVIPGSLFSEKSNSLSPVGRKQLEILANLLLEGPALAFEIEVHTDSRKSHRFNQILSEERAAEIRSFLVEKGVVPTRFSLKPFGEENLLIDCENDCEFFIHKKNDRVAIRAKEISQK